LKLFQWLYYSFELLREGWIMFPSSRQSFLMQASQPYNISLNMEKSQISEWNLCSHTLNKFSSKVAMNFYFKLQIWVIKNGFIIIQLSASQCCFWSNYFDFFISLKSYLLSPLFPHFSLPFPLKLFVMYRFGNKTFESWVELRGQTLKFQIWSLRTKSCFLFFSLQTIFRWKITFFNSFRSSKNSRLILAKKLSFVTEKRKWIKSPNIKCHIMIQMTHYCTYTRFIEVFFSGSEKNTLKCFQFCFAANNDTLVFFNLIKYF